MCDDCHAAPIVGARYHCRTCVDVDLCLACYRKTSPCGHAFDRHRIDDVANVAFMTEAKKSSTRMQMLGRPGAPHVDKAVLGSL